MNTDNQRWLRVIPLGGLGHIGGNMMVYETEQDLVMVDCGVLFPTVQEPGIDYVVPDISYVLQRKDKFRGMVLTHGHEDHIGALPFLLPMLGKTTLVATPFTCALMRNKLSEHPEITADIRQVKDRQKFALGNMIFDPLAVTHSIPHAVALAISTPVGTVVHTGDFKIDPDPLDGRVTDLPGLRAYGDAGVALLCSDSTNSQKPGRTWSEREVQTALREVIGAAPNRVFLTTFASHIDRIQAVCDAAVHAGRKVICVGRSMRQNVGLAQEMGILRAPGGLFVEPENFPGLRRNKLVVLASGSQGEPFSSMSRIAQGTLQPMCIDPGDMVIFSSRKIPGNERAISEMVNNLVRQGAEIIGDTEARVHSSGHAFQDEQQDMIEACRPQAFMPVHGELRHMVAHAGLAQRNGVPKDNIAIVEDGWPVLLTRDQDGHLEVVRDKRVTSGLLFVDGKGVGDVGEVVLRDRRYLSESGIVACVIVLSFHGEVVVGPEIVTRGMVYVDESLALLDRASQAVRQAIESNRPVDVDAHRDEVRTTLRRFFKKTLGRKPMIVPVVLRLPERCCD